MKCRMATLNYQVSRTAFLPPQSAVRAAKDTGRWLPRKEANAVKATERKVLYQSKLATCLCQSIKAPRRSLDFTH